MKKQKQALRCRIGAGLLGCSALALVASSGGAMAGDSPCQESYVMSESSFGAARFDRLGDFVFFPVVREGLVIVDVSDPLNHQEVGRADSSLILNDVSVDGDLAVVKSRDSGILIYDISDVSSPELVSHTQSGRDHVSIAVVDGVLFAGRRNAGLDVFDLSDPSQPELVSTLGDASYVGDMDLDDEVLYIASGDQGMTVVDVSVPLQPQLLTQFDVLDQDQFVVTLEVNDGVALLHMAEDEFALIDVQSPLEPFFLSYLPAVTDRHSFNRFCLAVDAEYDRVYYSSPESHVFVFDIENRFSPEFIGQVPLLGVVYGMEFENGMGFMSTTQGAFQYVDVAAPTSFAPLSLESEFGGEPQRVGILPDERTMVVSDFEGGLRLFDVVDPSSPTLIGEVDFDGSERGFALRGDLMYLAAGEAGFRIVQLSDDLDHVELINSVDTPGDAQDVFLDGVYAYVSDLGGGVQIFNIQNPFMPQLVGSYQTEWRVTDAHVSDGVLFANDPDWGVHLVDVTDPTQPTKLAQVGSTGGSVTRRIGLHDDLLTVGYGWNRLYTYDVSEPSDPELVSESSFGSQISHSILVGDIMYYAGEWIYAVDVSDLTALRPIWNCEFGYAIDMILSGDRLLAVGRLGPRNTAIGDGGLVTIELDDCRALCQADLNFDQQLNFFDVAVFLVAYMDEEPIADFNFDGEFDFFDVTSFIESFLAGCP